MYIVVSARSTVHYFYCDADVCRMCVARVHVERVLQISLRIELALLACDRALSEVERQKNCIKLKCKEYT